MKVLKFGGSSLATPCVIRDVCRIVRRSSEAGPIAVVVSAFGGVTDDLLDVLRRAPVRPADETRARCAEIEQRHHEALDALVPGSARGAVRAEVDRILHAFVELVDGARLVAEASPFTMDRGLGIGERLSSHIVAAALDADGVNAEACDARPLIRTDASFGQARVDFEVTNRQVREHFAGAGPLQIVTGFVASTADGRTTTLGRGGSDYTASILGAALGAEAVELWTDVDGVMSADPRIVPDARPLRLLSYEELMELSHFGAKVVHPPSVHPTRAREIPLVIRNTMRPEGPGTVVSDAAHEPGALPDGPIIGVASIERVALLRLEGDGMVGVPGIAERLFGALARRDVSIIMISQASSEHSICFAIRDDATEAAAAGVEEAFATERAAGLIDELVIERDLAVVAAVGAGMRERAGIAGRVFGVLGAHGVNVRAIAQGSSELNISLVVGGEDEARAVRAIHDAFFVAGVESARVVIAGVGRVGTQLLAQIADRLPDVRIVGVADSQGARVDRTGLEAATAVETLKSSDERRPFEEMMRLIVDEPGAARILVDCTAGDDVPEWYLPALASGASVVTANKRRVAESTAVYDALVATRPGRLYLETTVGAALPVIETLRDLVATGDRVHRIEGLLSGTLSFLANHMAEGHPLSASVRAAYDRGYTEPDPREDLAGRDAARKLLILARIAGWSREPDDVGVESLLAGEGWAELSIDEFWARLPSLDAGFEERREAAARDGGKLVYLARADRDAAGVSLVAVGPDHPCHGVAGTDNLIAFTTDRYAETPLVVRGPGAGPALTASGVFADVLRALRAEGNG